MVQQQEQQPRMPKFIEAPTTQVLDIELTASEAMNAWVWPICSWLLVVMNSAIAMIAISNMMRDGYNAPMHFFMTGSFILTFAAIALVYKAILRGK